MGYMPNINTMNPTTETIQAIKKQDAKYSSANFSSLEDTLIMATSNVLSKNPESQQKQRERIPSDSYSEFSSCSSQDIAIESLRKGSSSSTYSQSIIIDVDMPEIKKKISKKKISDKKSTSKNDFILGRLRLYTSIDYNKKESKLKHNKKLIN